MIVPLGKYLLIERVPPPAKTDAGLYLPDTVDRTKPAGAHQPRGKVVAVGEEVKAKVHPGDEVLIGDHGSLLPVLGGADDAERYITHEDNLRALYQGGEVN